MVSKRKVTAYDWHTTLRSKSAKKAQRCFEKCIILLKKCHRVLKRICPNGFEELRMSNDIFLLSLLYIIGCAPDHKVTQQESSSAAALKAGIENYNCKGAPLSDQTQFFCIVPDRETQCNSDHDHESALFQKGPDYHNQFSRLLRNSIIHY